MDDGIDQDEVKNAILRFTKDKKWCRIFSEAPEGARRRMALNFWVTVNKDSPGFRRDVYLSLRAAIERTLDFDDLEYLVVTAQNDAAKAHFRELLFALPPENTDVGGEGGRL